MPRSRRPTQSDIARAAGVSPAVVSLVIDVIAGAIYIGAGQRLTAAMSDHATRRRLDIGIGLLFIAIGAGILMDIVMR